MVRSSACSDSAPGNGVASDYEPGHSHYAALPSRSGNGVASNYRRPPQKPLFVGSRLFTVCRVWLLVNRTDHTDHPGGTGFTIACQTNCNTVHP
jgi:hypothetical protein